MPTPSPPRPPQVLDAAWAGRCARIALVNVTQEYPNHLVHLLGDAADARTPRELHPAFYGSYDWHSCVHMHWLLVRVMRLHPALPERPRITALLAHLTPAAIAGEVAYFQRPGAQSFERPYGWAWLLALAGELALAAPLHAEAKRAHDALAPLTGTIATRFLEFLPRAGYPVRYGMHANSAFALLLAFESACASAAAPFAAAIAAKALDWFDADADLPAAWEPSGADFLSPALVEAHLMSRVLPPDAFATWLAQALPGLATGTPRALLAPAVVADRTDPQIVHLDGLNLSRAWCLRAIAASLPLGDARVEVLQHAAARHLDAGLQGLDSAEYVGSHWLATFATLALTR